MPAHAMKRDPEISREKILDAAEDLFAQKGFAGTSMSGVARLSGKSQALIHHHFTNKKGLWEAVKERFGTRFARVLLPMLDSRPMSADFIRSWSRQYLEFWKENPNLRRIMLWRQLENDHTPWEATNHLFELSLVKIREGQEKGVFRPDVDAGHIISILSGAHLTWLNNRPAFCYRSGLDPDDPDVDEAYLKDLEKILLSGLLPGCYSQI